MNIGIVGGGLMGLATAYYLSKAGHTVQVFEKEPQMGGLTTHHDFGPFVWDRFYHVILPTDTALTGLIEDIGLADRLRWRRTYTGFYVDRRFYSMSTNLEFLRFPPVSLLGKVRMAITILYCARIKNWRRLEKIPLEQWLVKWSGRHTYEKLWKPLLLAKLGEHYKRVSAVFIWSYIKRMYSARETSAASKEHMGHVSGGYKTVFDRIAGHIENSGGRIHLETGVTGVEPDGERGVQVSTDAGLQRFDKVIFTGPVNLLQAVTDTQLRSVEETGGQVEYLGVVCGVLITRKPLVPYYVVNITDRDIPFTGVIGMSSIVDPAETGGWYFTYLPKYVLSTDPFLKEPDESVKTLFFDGLRKMFPDLDAYGVEALHINRAAKVQPLQVIDYSTLVPDVRSRHPDFYVLNTTQFVNSTLNNNEVVKAVNGFIREYGDDFQVPAGTVPSS